MSSPINVSYINERSMITVGALFPTLSIIFVGLRFYVRRQQRARILADDWLLIPATLIVIVMGIAFIIGAKRHGLGFTKGVPAGDPLEAQFTYLSPEVILTEKIQFICQLMSVVCIGCIKLSVVMFYRRIFVTQNRDWFSVITAIIGAIIVAWTIAFFFVFLFYCGTHIPEEWGTVADVIQFCPNALNDDLAIGISDAIVDLVILILPIPMILGLHLDITKKIMIISIFLLGGFAVASSIVRMAVFIQVVVVGFNPALDGDKDIALVLFWTMVEAGTAIVAACLPTLKALTGTFTIEKFLRSIRNTFSLHSNSRSKTTIIIDFPNASSSMEYITKPGTTSTVETYAMRDIDNFDTRSSGSGIKMSKSFHQESSRSQV